jgi:hypothetical protein
MISRGAEGIRVKQEKTMETETVGAGFKLAPAMSTPALTQIGWGVDFYPQNLLD